MWKWPGCCISSTWPRHVYLYIHHRLCNYSPRSIIMRSMTADIKHAGVDKRAEHYLALQLPRRAHTNLTLTASRRSQATFLGGLGQ